MSFILVNKSKFRGFEGTVKDLNTDIKRINNEFLSIGRNLDWDIRSCAGIDQTINQISSDLERHALILNKMANFFIFALQQYEKIDQEQLAEANKFVSSTAVTPQNQSIVNDILKWFGLEKLNPQQAILLAANPTLLPSYAIGKLISDSINSNSPFGQFITNKLKAEGSVINGKIETLGQLFGICAGVSATGNVLGYEASVKNSASANLKKGEVGFGTKAKAEGYVAKGEVSGKIGLLSESVALTAVAASASGEAKCALFDDGHFDPALELKAEAEAVGLKGEVKGQLGNEQFNVNAGAEGSVGVASAEAECAISKDGIDAKAEVGAAVFKGEVKTGFTLFGVKVDLSGEGEALGVGAKVEAGVTKDSFELGGKLSCLAGLGLKLKISW